MFRRFYVPVAFLSAMFFSCALKAEEFSARIVDGLGNPIAGVDVEVAYYPRSNDRSLPTRPVVLLKLRSDEKGNVRGTYDAKTLKKDEYPHLVFHKRQGYVSGYSESGRFEPEYVLKRIFSVADFVRVEKLTGESQSQGLKELLAGVLDGGDLDEKIFYRDHLFRASLRRLIGDTKVGDAALETLASIGVPEDLDWIVKHAPAPIEEGWRSSWATDVASAMMDPVSEEGWAFLEKCAFGVPGFSMANADAINTLMLIASPEALRILEQVAVKNPKRAREAQAAMAYIKSKPAPLADRDLLELARRVGRAVGKETWEGIELPIVNEKKDKARVRLNFVDGRDSLTCTGTFHNVDGTWKLRGFREYQHGLIADEPKGPRQDADK